ncbi:MAG: DUF885 domain-containing protein [Actinomycetota bacterium]|nr:DUF885 domain-containing protein [Actinomycetota bacterium]MDQ2957109.1 DUF885 domain-containing protein [Actinomycetota bacterium]
MAPEQFAGIATDAIAAYCAEYPAVATLLGNHDHDDRLGDPSKAATDRRRAELGRVLDRLDGLTGADNPTGLDPAAAVDCDVLRTEANRELLSLGELDEPSWDALQHNPGKALHSIIAREFAPLPERLTSVAGRLRGVPDYLAAARQRLTDPPAEHVQMAIGQLAGTHALITGEIAKLADQAGRGAELAGGIERAAAAVLDYQGWLREQLPTARTSARLGEQSYARKLGLALATAWQPADLLAQAYTDLARIESELAELVAARLGARAGRAEIAGEFARLAADVPSNADVVDRCRDALAETTRFVEQHELLSLLHDPVEVLEMPEVDRGVAVAYCEGVGPLETAPLRARFAVSPAPADWPDEQVRSFYREFNNHMLHNLTVHEAMPGHVEQLSHARRYRGDTLVRAVFESSTFIEGWAVYAEELMAERGYRSEISTEAAAAVRTHQLRAQLRMVLTTILDVSYHAGDLDEAGALELMTGRGYYAQQEAAGRWRRVQLTATWPPIYYIGYLEIRGVATDLRAAHPDWTDRQLHDTMLSHGSPPARYLRTLLGLPPAA